MGNQGVTNRIKRFLCLVFIVGGCAHEDGARGPGAWSLLMHTLANVPTDATYEQLRVGAERLGWRAQVSNRPKDYRLFLYPRDGETLKLGDAFMEGRQTNAIIIACAPPSPTACRARVDELVRASGVDGDGRVARDDDSQGGELNCRRGGERAHVNVGPGTLAPMREMLKKLGFSRPTASSGLARATMPVPPPRRRTTRPTWRRRSPRGSGSTSF